jgi:hypothetical protein
MFGCRPIWKIGSVEQDKRSMVGCCPIQKSVWVKQEKQLMVGCRLIRRGVWVCQRKWSMVNEGKRLMMCHSTLTSTCYVMSSSTCCAMSSKLTPHDDVSCHVNIHCHSTSSHNWLTTNGQVDRIE